MKALASHRADLEILNTFKEGVSESVPADDISKNILPFLGGNDEGSEGALSSFIRLTITAIRTISQKDSWLVHLRDSIPFSKEHAPDLFESNEATSVAGPEFWMMLQDLFFETPGVNAVLNEFFPEEEEEEEPLPNRLPLINTGFGLRVGSEEKEEEEEVVVSDI